MKRLVFFLGLWAAAAPAQSLTPPLAGLISDSNHRLHRVFGVAGNFILGAEPAAEVQSSAFSGRFGLVKTPGAVLTLDHRGEVIQTSPAPEGPAVFAFDGRGTPALAYFPSTGELRDLRPGGESRTLEFSGVLGIRRSEVLLFLDGRLWRASAGGMAPVSSDEFEQAPPALLRPDGTVLYVSGNDLVVAAPDGDERRLTLPEPCDRLEQMSAEWVQAGSSFAVRLEDLKLYRLPEVTP
jgi:hypothetical protein